MKKTLIFPIVFLLIMLVLPTVESWGPHAHNKIDSELLIENSTEIGRICGATEENRKAFLLGGIAPDLTVSLYYSEGGKEYRLTHNFLFQQEVTSQAQDDAELCFSWGISAHLIQDSISHTQVVPSAIKKFKVKNWLLHPLLEKKYDSALVKENPSLLTTTPRMMDALDGPKADRYIEMIDFAMGDNSQIDVKSELTKLRFALDEFYETQFKPTGSTWIFKAYPYIDKLTNSLEPVIGRMKFANIDFYYKKSKDETVNVFNNWGSRFQISPHGFDELKAADRNSTFVFTLVLIGAFVVPLGLVYFRRSPIYALLIPVILLILIVWVYASL